MIDKWEPVYCKHDITAIDIAIDVDGLCPLCQSDLVIEQRLEIDRLRAELSEAKAALGRTDELLHELDLAKTALRSAEAHIRELNDKWADDVLRLERAEAERDALRKVLSDVEYFSNDPYVVKIARAALTLSVREE